MKAKPKNGRKLSAQDRKSIDLLHRAAGCIASGEATCCCSALLFAAEFSEFPYHDYLLMKILFKQDSSMATISAFWWDIGDLEPRIFALLLAAEVIRTNSQP